MLLQRNFVLKYCSSNKTTSTLKINSHTWNCNLNYNYTENKNLLYRFDTRYNVRYTDIKLVLEGMKQLRTKKHETLDSVFSA